MHFSRFGWAAGGLFAVAAIVATVEADAGAGSYTLTPNPVAEADGAWRLKMEVRLPSPPSIGHPTFRFQFTPTAVFERSLKDGDKVEVVRQALIGQTPINETMEVGFTDHSGKIWKSTRFAFSLTRDRGYQAGEYSLVVTGPNGDVGRPKTVVLSGDNPIVDRRTMDFSRPAPGTPLWDGGTDSSIKSL